MTDFWDAVLGQTPPPPAPDPSPSGGPWWQSVSVTAPAQQTPAPAPQEPSAANHSPQESMERVQWARDTEGNCPSCGSGNYARHPEQPRARARCFDCGYPLTQSGTGMAAQGKEMGPVKEARQVSGARTNSFNIHQIVHHVHPQEMG